jgi:sialic acid synthase SpsE
MVEKSLGSVRTGPTTSELKFKKLMRKSIGTSMDIRSGTKIKKSMLTTFRPGTGISPPFIDKFVGMTIKKDVKKGTLINWDMF